MAGGSSRPSISYNAAANRWEVRSKGGTLRLSIDDTGLAILHSRGLVANFTGTLADLNVGSTAALRRFNVGGGSNITRTTYLVGSSAPFPVGTTSMAIGSIDATGINTGDAVICTSRTAITASMGISGFYVSGNNNINFYAVNPCVTNGTFPVNSWTVLGFRMV